MPAPDNYQDVDADVCCGARPGDAEAAWLYAAGVRSVIDLELGQEDQAAWAAWPSVQYRHLADWEPLAMVHIIEDHHIRSVLSAIRTLPKRVYAHCHAGENRTRVAVGAYQLVDKGMDIETVITQLRSYHGLWAGQDEAYLRDLAKRVDDFR